MQPNAFRSESTGGRSVLILAVFCKCALRDISRRSPRPAVRMFIEVELSEPPDNRNPWVCSSSSIQLDHVWISGRDALGDDMETIHPSLKISEVTMCLTCGNLQIRRPRDHKNSSAPGVHIQTGNYVHLARILIRS